MKIVGINAKEVVSLIQSQKPTAFGVQEALLEQMTYIDSALVDYEYLGVGRDDGRIKENLVHFL